MYIHLTTVSQYYILQVSVSTQSSCAYVPSHESVWGSESISPCILNFGTRWT